MQFELWVLSLHVAWEDPWNWRQAKGEVSHAWLMGASSVPGMTLFATCATLLRTMVVMLLLVVPAPTLVSHRAKPSPLVKALFTNAVMAK